jgi:hypothetical protein
MKTIKEYAEDAAARLRKSKNGSTPTKNEKSKLPKQQGRAQRPNVRPQGRGR